MTRATFAREALLLVTHQVYDCPVFTIPTITIAGTNAILLTRRVTDRTWLLFVPGISAITAPYGWFYDLVIIEPLYAYLISVSIMRYRAGAPLTLELMGILSVASYLAMGKVFYVWMLLYTFAIAVGPG